MPAPADEEIEGDMRRVEKGTVAVLQEMSWRGPAGGGRGD